MGKEIITHVKDTRPSWHGNPVRGPDGAYHGTTLDKAAKTLRLDHVFYDPARVQPYEFRVATGGRVDPGSVGSQQSFMEF